MMTTISKKRILLLMVLCAILITALIPKKTHAASWAGSYPTRCGTILVTPDKWRGLIPTGHAAIVWNKSRVIESINKGVSWGNNNWNRQKSKVYGVTVRYTTAKQDQRAADYCRRQIGKKYNYNYLNMSTRKKFYCSQLVWASFKDLYGIDLNTSQYSYKAIHPMELVNTSKTNLIYRYSR